MPHGKPPIRRSTRLESRTPPLIRFEEVGGPPKRGQVFAEVEARPKTLHELGFVMNIFTGEVRRPLFQEVKGKFGEIERKGEAVTQGLSRSERREMHKADSVENERKTLIQIAESIGKVHAYLVKQKGTLKDKKMRERLAAKLFEFVQRIGPRSRTTSKKKAVERLLLAINLARRGNDSAVAVSLIAAHRDLGERLSRLNIQQPRTERTSRVQQYELRDVMNRTRDWLARTREVMVVLSKSPTLGNMDEAAVYCERNAHNLGQTLHSNPPSEVIQIKESFENAGKKLRSGDVRGAMPSLLRARTYQLGLYSTHFILPSETIKLIPNWTVREMQTAALTRQVGLVEENMEYWRSSGRSSWIVPWLRNVTRVAYILPNEKGRAHHLNTAVKLLALGENEKARGEMRAYIERK